VLTARRDGAVLELSADSAGVGQLAQALTAAPGAFCQIAVGGDGFVAIRVKVKAGSSAVKIVRIGDVIHINGSSAKMAELAAALASLPANFAGHAAVDGASDPLVVCPA